MSDVDITLLLNEAIRLHKADEYQLAHDWYRTVLEHDQNNISALRLLAILLAQHGLHRQGQELTQQVLSLYGNGDRQLDDMQAFNFDVSAKYGVESDDIKKKCLNSGWPDLDMKTTNTWRHLRMLDFAPCFTDDDLSWLTIGDAYGHDFLLLKHYGIGSVVASNLNSGCLVLGHAIGAIGDHLEINAESITLPDNSFDYVLCKEAIHHMPRPQLAIYEMLRVARRAIILIEPRDVLIDWPAKKARSFWHHVQDNIISFGQVGNDSEISSQLIDWHEHEAANYVYTLSVRDYLANFVMGLESRVSVTRDSTIITMPNGQFNPLRIVRDLEKQPSKSHYGIHCARSRESQRPI